MVRRACGWRTERVVGKPGMRLACEGCEWRAEGVIGVPSV